MVVQHAAYLVLKVAGVQTVTIDVSVRMVHRVIHTAESVGAREGGADSSVMRSAPPRDMDKIVPRNAGAGMGGLVITYLGNVTVPPATQGRYVKTAVPRASMGRSVCQSVAVRMEVPAIPRLESVTVLQAGQVMFVETDVLRECGVKDAIRRVTVTMAHLVTTSQGSVNVSQGSVGRDASSHVPRASLEQTAHITALA